MVKSRLWWLPVAFLVPACVSSVNTDGYQFSCAAGGGCPGDQVCQNGLCVSMLDGGPDAGTDAGPDAGTDAGSDAGADAGPDAGPDGGLDDGGEPDSGIDAGPDGGAGGNGDGGMNDGGQTCVPSTVFVNARTVNVGTNPGGIVVGDFNNDGLLDYAVTDWGDGGPYDGRLNVFLGDGGQGFLRVIVDVGPTIEAVAVADLSHDGSRDIITVSAETDSFGVVEYQGADAGFAVIAAYDVGPDAGLPYQPNYGPVQVAVADLNGDGFDDVVLANNLNSTVSILYGNVDGGLSSPTVLATPQSDSYYLNGVAVGDLNGDQRPDLVIASGDGAVYIALALAGGGFDVWNGYQGGSTFGCFSPQCGAAEVVLIDLNHDGFLDAVVPETTDNEVDIFFNDGTGGLLLPPSRVSTVSADGDGGIGPLGVAVADFNGDGIPDIVAASGAPFPDFSNGCSGVDGFSQSLTFFAGALNSTDYSAQQSWVRDAPYAAPRWMVPAQFRSGEPPDLLVSYLNEIYLCDSTYTDCEGGLCGFDGTQASYYPNTCY